MTEFAELLAATHYSFLRGASHPADMVLQAVALGMKGIGIADRNTVAGVVKAHGALKDLRARVESERKAQEAQRDAVAVERSRHDKSVRAERSRGPYPERSACGTSLDCARHERAEGSSPGPVAGMAAEREAEREGEEEGEEESCSPPHPFVLSLSKDVKQTPRLGHVSQDERGKYPPLQGEGDHPQDGGGVDHVPAKPSTSGVEAPPPPPSAAVPLPCKSREGCEALDFRLVVGARLVFADGTPDILAYPIDRKGWGSLTRLLTTGNLRAEKGDCILRLNDLLEHCDQLLLIAVADETHEFALRRIARHAPLWIAATMPRQGDDARRLARRMRLSAATGIPLIASCDALYATPEQRPLHDVVTCIREGVTLAEAGTRLLAHAERHLKAPAEMARLFHACPQAVAESIAFLDRISFSLDDLSYEYPHEPVPEGWDPMDWLEHETLEGGAMLYPDGIPDTVMTQLREEFRIIKLQNYAYYFLTVYEAVKYARSLDPPILCQGRGSAANSAVCYCLGITSVDPSKSKLLFSRFISAERNEPPDIDVDFEHERREEVMQEIYRKYGRDRAAIVATVIHYRPRSAVREVGKVLGLSEDVTARLTSTVWGSFADRMETRRFSDAGFDLLNADLERLRWIVDQLLHTPRHLSQHVGGFVLTQDRLDETVPIHNAAMEDRTFIEWDKDDIDTLKLMKVDVLALGMLSCIRKGFELMRTHGFADLELATVPQDTPEVYDMLCAGDSIGVFQVESRAQINMLPRLKPRVFYDLAVQVAIVRPGPIEGDMVHPYLRRREEYRLTRKPFEYPRPDPPHDANELVDVLGKTFGVPLFQEQAMNLAITAAAFTPDEANQLRRAMATFRNVGTIGHFEEKMVKGMVARGYEEDFARRCYAQIKGFGSYGFPESHAISFALLVYVSAWLKCTHPAVFAAALLNAQPMGFYAPAQIVRDAREHGVAIHPIDVNHSDWDNGLDAGATDGTPHPRWHWRVAESRRDGGFALRLGLRQIDGFQAAWAHGVTQERLAGGSFASIEDIKRRVKVALPDGGMTSLPARALRLLADADACRSIGRDRREAAWEAQRMPAAPELPLFAAARARELEAEPEMDLPAMPLAEHVTADYQTTRLSLKEHPMRFLRETLRSERILSAEELLAVPNGKRAKVAGVVLVRQRPGKGNAIFATLEDETGIVNILLWARMLDRYRMPLMAARLMEAHGVVQKSREGVMHLMADRIVDRTPLLEQLTDRGAPPVPLSRADVVAHPQIPRTRHPRDVRVLPKSRDFH